MSASPGALREVAPRATDHAPAATRWPAIPGFKPRAEDALAHALARVPAMALVLGSGLTSTAVYALFVTAFPITRYASHPHADGNPNAINDLGRITHYSPLAAIAFVAAILALFACHFLAFNAVTRRGSDASAWVRRLGMAFPLLFTALLIFMQPVTTTDLYGYVARGYLYAHLRFNPMTTPAFLLPGCPASVASHLSSGAQCLVSRPPAPYGPLWLLIAGGLSLLSGENLLLNMLAFKVIGAAGVLVALWLVHVLATRLYPGSASRIVMFLAWNPLLLFEAVGNGHNDIIMMDCVLAALVLMLHRYARTAFALLVLGALIKYVAAILIPLWLVYELAQRRADQEDKPVAVAWATPNGHQRRAPAQSAAAPHAGSSTQRSGVASTPAATLTQAGAALVGSARATLRAIGEVDRRAALELLAGAGAIGALLVIGCYAPFWDGGQTFSGLGQQIRPLYYNSSLVQFIAAPLEILVAPRDYAALDKTVRLGFYAVFALYAWLQTYRLWRLGTAVTLRDLITSGAKVTFAALILIAFWYQPWYVVWLLPLAALADDAFVRSRAVILAAGSLLTYAVGNYLFVNEPGIGQALFVQFFEVLVAFVPLLLLRITPRERGWQAVARGYLGLLGEGLRLRSQLWDRVMLGLILVVAILLRLVRLGNLFGAINPDTVPASALRQLSGDLRLILADPNGLEGPFALLQRAMITAFGPTPFAALLPSAVIGSLTVWLIYLVTTVIFADGSPARARAIGLMAALLAATSHWHVSLSRSGVQVVLLPFLMCLALYLFLRALRMAPVAAAHEQTAPRRHVHYRPGRQRRLALAPAERTQARRRLLLFVGSGIAAGLASDLAPGLWILSLMLLGMLLIARWQRPDWFQRIRPGLGALTVAGLLAALPGIWRFWLSNYIGFPAGSGALAQSSAAVGQGAALFSPAYFAQITRNASSMLHVLTAQDYSAGWPSNGGAPILPGIVVWFLYGGILLVVWRWRRLSSLAILLLLALPLLASVAVGTEPTVIEAASILPAMCIVPALALYQAACWLGALPIALDRANGARVFANPDRIGRMLFMVFLLISALRTFYWYFQATLPTTPLNTTIPS
jgi:hypothetical protein